MTNFIVALGISICIRDQCFWMSFLESPPLIYETHYVYLHLKVELLPRVTCMKVVMWPFFSWFVLLHEAATPLGDLTYK